MDYGGAVVALVGAGAGAGVTVAVEWVRARIGDRASRRDALLNSCSNFTAAVARTRSLSYDLTDNPENQARIRLQLEEARVECERLRLLIDSRETQQAARLALRHLWAVWHSPSVVVIREPTGSQTGSLTNDCGRSLQSSTSVFAGKPARDGPRMSSRILTRRSSARSRARPVARSTGRTEPCQSAAGRSARPAHQCTARSSTGSCHAADRSQ